MAQYVLALDQGTTSSRAILFDKQAHIVAIAQQEFPQLFPKPGWVEHDPEEILRSQRATIDEVLQKAAITKSDIAALGITNQRETTIIWDRHSGRPIYNALVWQDRRTAKICEDLKRKGFEEIISSKTGLLLDAYFSASKIKWILDTVPGARQRAENGDLAFGTVDSWLVWNLTGGKKHITEPSNASRTMLFNIHSMQWDEELLELFNVPSSILPEVLDSSQIYADYDGIPISGIAGDQQAALFGQGCLESGMAKNTYGTGCFMLMNTGTQIITSKNKLLTSVAWKIGKEVTYALEGSIFVAGAVVQWLRDGLRVIQTSAEIENLARDVDTSDGVYLVPAFTGLGAPHWDPDAKGIICGLTRGTTSGHIARAALEAIAFQVTDVLEAMNSDTGLTLKELRVDGGACRNDLLMQFQADLLNTPVLRSEIVESTALGAAFLAGLAVGFWKDAGQLAKLRQNVQRFEPAGNLSAVAILRAGWKDAVRRSRSSAN